MWVLSYARVCRDVHPRIHPTHTYTSVSPHRHADTLTHCLFFFRQTQILPPGASKGKGVAALLQALDIDPCHVLAIGDAENDVEVQFGVCLYVYVSEGGEEKHVGVCLCVCVDRRMTRELSPTLVYDTANTQS